MVLRRPLVRRGGRTEQLPGDDTLLVQTLAATDSSSAAASTAFAHALLSLVGLGDSAAPVVGDIDALTANQFFRIAAADAKNPFVGTSATGLNLQESSDYGWQLLGVTGGSFQLKGRIKLAGVWSDWFDLWHSGNLTPTGVTAPGPWQTPTLLNGWVNYGSAAGFTYRSARFRKHNDGLVVVEGLIKGGVVGGAGVAFTLPVGFRPTQRLVCSGYSNGVVSRIDVTPDGDVIAYAGSNGYFPVHFAFAAG